MATYSFEGPIAAEAALLGRASLKGAFAAEAALGGRPQARGAFRAEAALIGEAEHDRPAPAMPRLQTVDSAVEWRT